MTACSRLIARNGSTASMTWPTRVPFRVHILAGLAFPFVAKWREIVPPSHSSRHRLTIRSSVDTTAMCATQCGYRGRFAYRIMNDPSPSRIPASHAASAHSIPESYCEMAAREMATPTLFDLTPAEETA